MLEKIASFILSMLIPAGLLTGLEKTVEPAPVPLHIRVEPLAKSYHETRHKPETRAKAVLVIETHSNEVLFSKNVWDILPIASLTKLMTALIVRERLPLDQEITVALSVLQVGGSRMGLKAGEIITVENLLKGLLISSGNDAALVLSEAVSGTVEGFVSAMNERTSSLGLVHTSFVDPMGISDLNVSSAFEIAHLAKHVFKDPFLQSLLREKSLQVSSVDQRIRHDLINTNRLLGTDIADRIIAGKTGTTPHAGQCLISFFNINHTDRTTMIILLGSPNRYEEMSTLIPWIDETFYWE